MSIHDSLHMYTCLFQANSVNNNVTHSVSIILLIKA